MSTATAVRHRQTPRADARAETNRLPRATLHTSNYNVQRYVLQGNAPMPKESRTLGEMKFVDEEEGTKKRKIEGKLLFLYVCVYARGRICMYVYVNMNVNAWVP